MKSKKWVLLLFLFLLLSILTMNFIGLVVYAFAKIYLYFVRDVPFLTYLPGLYKIIRGASFGGIVVGIGCWYVYYRNEHS